MENILKIANSLYPYLNLSSFETLVFKELMSQISESQNNIETLSNEIQLSISELEQLVRVLNKEIALKNKHIDWSEYVLEESTAELMEILCSKINLLNICDTDETDYRDKINEGGDYE